MPSSVTAVLAWLHAQASVLLANVGDVFANRPAPAGRVVICTLVTLVLAFAALKIARKASK